MTSADFANLSARTQIMRLCKLAREALRHYDLQPERIQLLSHSFNTIFQVKTSSERYVLRVNIPNIREVGQIRAEMAWLAALHRDTDLPLPRPLANRKGALVTTVSIPGVPEARHCAIFGWLPGRLLADKISPPTLRQLGAIAARLHRHGQRFKLPSGAALEQLDHVPFGSKRAVFFNEEHEALFPPERLEIFRQSLERVRGCLKELYDQKVPPQVLHADLHQWNLKLYKGRLSVLDFDDCALGYPVQDLGITLYYLQGHSEYPALREAFRHGYEQEADWPETRAGQIDTLIAGRSLDLANFVLISPNPRWRAEAANFLARTEARLRDFLAQ